MVKSLKNLVTAAVVLAIPAFAVYGLMASPSSSAQLASDLHFFDPLHRHATQGAGAVEEVDLGNWVGTWGSSPTPPPPINPKT